MYTNGELEVHDNVTLEANTADGDGGAVSLPFDIGAHLSALDLWDIFGKGRFDSARQLMLVSELHMRLEFTGRELMPMGAPDQEQNPRL